MSNRALSITLLGDGPSDRCLLRALRWLIIEHARPITLESAFADLRMLPSPGKTLAERVRTTLEFYPCDILFVHRDAERESREKRMAEIASATRDAGATLPWVAVIPVRMTEAWLLVDERAIRMAADNPRGSNPLGLPAVATIEQAPDPKHSLKTALEAACGKTGRRLDQFRRDLPMRVQRVADLIDDLTPLRHLTAFRALEADIVHALDALSHLCGAPSPNRSA